MWTFFIISWSIKKIQILRDYQKIAEIKKCWGLWSPLQLGPGLLQLFTINWNPNRNWNWSIFREFILLYMCKNNFSRIFRFSRKMGPFLSFFAKNVQHYAEYTKIDFTKNLSRSKGLKFPHCASLKFGLSINFESQKHQFWNFFTFRTFREFLSYVCLTVFGTKFLEMFHHKLHID